MTIRRHNYFYEPIEGTPFSLGLALPEGYGMLEVLAEHEIKLSIINGNYIEFNSKTQPLNNLFQTFEMKPINPSTAIVAYLLHHKEQFLKIS